MLDDKERQARCAWACYLDDLVAMHGGMTVEDSLIEVGKKFSALSAEQQKSHLAWRESMGAALEEAIHDHCPGHGDCCDRTFWPDTADRPRATIAELGYFESLSRQIKSLSPRARIRILMAALVMESAEGKVTPETLARELLVTARVYQGRLYLLISPEPYDGNGLIGYAFPKEPGI